MLPRRLRKLPRHDLGGGVVIIEANTWCSRLIGLAGLRLRDIPRWHALLLRPCRSVHTLGMCFELDLIFLSDQGTVLEVERGVPPARIRTCRRAAAVLECPPQLSPPGFPFDRLDYADLLRRPSPPGARA